MRGAILVQRGGGGEAVDSWKGGEDVEGRQGGGGFVDALLRG